MSSYATHPDKKKNDYKKRSPNGLLFYAKSVFQMNELTIAYVSVHDATVLNGNGAFDLLLIVCENGCVVLHESLS